MSETLKTTKGKLLMMAMVLATMLATMLAGTLIADRAEAETVKGQWGIVGASDVVDDAQYPGVACGNYDAYNRSIGVRPPKMWAHPNYPNGQYVSWRVTLLENNPYRDYTSFRILSQTSWKQGIAYPNSFPFFSARTLTVPRYNQPMNYIVYIDMRWHNPRTGAMEGDRRYEINYYHNTVGLHQGTVRASCAF